MKKKKRAHEEPLCFEDDIDGNVESIKDRDDKIRYIYDSKNINFDKYIFLLMNKMKLKSK